MRRDKLEYLKVELFKNKISYKKLAEYIGISVNTVNKRMNGRGNFDCAEATIISDLLGFDVNKRAEIFLSK